MPRNPSDPELRIEFSEQMKQVLKQVSAREAARVLGVKAQMIYNYKNARNVPSPEVIRRAMEAWSGFKLNYRGHTLTLQDYQRKPVTTPRKALQYELWDVIKKIDPRSVEIEVLDREESSVQLGVRIKFYVS